MSALARSAGPKEGGTIETDSKDKIRETGAH
jgi:hypothetical protein